MSVKSAMQAYQAAKQQHWGAGKTFVEVVKSLFRGHSVSSSESDPARFTPPKGNRGAGTDPLGSRKVSTSDEGVHYSAASGQVNVSGGATPEGYPVAPERLKIIQQDVDMMGRLARGEMRTKGGVKFEDDVIVQTFKTHAKAHQYTSTDLKVALDLMNKGQKVSPALQRLLGESIQEQLPFTNLVSDFMDELYFQHGTNAERFSAEVKYLYENDDKLMEFLTTQCVDSVAENAVILNDEGFAQVKQAILLSVSPEANLNANELFPDASHLHADRKAKFDQ